MCQQSSGTVSTAASVTDLSNTSSNNSNSNSNSSSSNSNSESNNNENLLLTYMGQDEMLGKIKVNIRTQYSQRPHKKVQQISNSFGWFLRNLKEYSDGKTISDETFKQLVSSAEDPLYVAKSKIPKTIYYTLGFPLPPVEEKKIKSPGIWCGPKGSGATLHYDHFDNFALQIIGEKTWKIIPPYHASEAGYTTPTELWRKISKEEKSEPVWTKTKTGLGATIEAPHSLLPDIRKVIDKTGSLELTLKTPTETKKMVLDVFVVTLKPMEMLYLPAYFGHAVQNVTMSCMINFFPEGIPTLLDPSK